MYRRFFGVAGWDKFFRSRPIVRVFLNHFIYYPTPAMLNYHWSYGSLAGICLISQIVTGVLLACHYIPHEDLAFDSVEHIMRNVPNGWLIRYQHSNGASMFFIVVYMHIIRGFWYRCYIYESMMAWVSGVFILVLMMITAFLGYVLPWGQMSFWGTTVITSLVSTVPLIGDQLLFYVWGGYTVGGPTLTRFYSFHYFLPFVIVVAVLFHISEVHEIGSSTPFPLNPRFEGEVIFFYPYFFLKDLIAFLVFCIVFSYFIFFAPNYLGHVDNYIKADYGVTPKHIVPEWYFLPFYAILRCGPSKGSGVLLMLGVIVVLFLLPILTESASRKHFSQRLRRRGFRYVKTLYFHNYNVTFLVTSFMFLGWIGSKPAVEPYISVGYKVTWFFYAMLLSLTIIC